MVKTEAMRGLVVKGDAVHSERSLRANGEGQTIGFLDLIVGLRVLFQGNAEDYSFIIQILEGNADDRIVRVFQKQSLQFGDRSRSDMDHRGAPQSGQYLLGLYCKRWSPSRGVEIETPIATSRRAGWEFVTTGGMAMTQVFFALGCLFACTGVAAGAFGAHMLKGIVGTDLLAVFETGVRYQMYHAFGLLWVAWALRQWSHRSLRWTGWLFVAGIVLFSGSLYLLTFSGIRWMGVLTPLGGTAFLTGWVLLGWAVWHGTNAR